MLLQLHQIASLLSLTQVQPFDKRQLQSKGKNTVFHLIGQCMMQYM